MVSVFNRFELDARYDTLLVKLPFVTCVPGFGRELCAFDAAKDRPGDFGEDEYAVLKEVRGYSPARLFANALHRPHPRFMKQSPHSTTSLCPRRPRGPF